MTSREQRLQSWAHDQLASMGTEPGAPLTLENLSGDASFRRYFRLHLPSNSYIVVDAPPETEDNRAFVTIADRLRDAGVMTPRVHAADFEQGFMLQEDFGDTLFLERLRGLDADEPTVRRLYLQAIDSLVRLQAQVAQAGFAPFDRRELMREMRLFEDWFCVRLLGLTLSPVEQKLIEDAQLFLAREFEAQPQVVVHRDYHSRNLMIPDPQRYQQTAKPGVIDFQDAVIGAYTYDLVSLLRDCYIAWPQSLVIELARYYKSRAEGEGVIAGIAESTFLRHFDLAGLQRNLKVMGIFARLSIRDNKPGFLADIPQTMRYFLDVSAAHPELAALLDWVTETVLPRVNERLPGSAQCEA